MPKQVLSTRFCALFSLTFPFFSSLLPLDVRPSMPTTYVQTTSGRTSRDSMGVRAGNLWTYVQATNPPKRGKFIPLNHRFQLPENRLIAREGVLTLFFRILGGGGGSRK